MTTGSKKAPNVDVVVGKTAMNHFKKINLELNLLHYICCGYDSFI